MTTEEITKPCPLCGRPLVRRVNRVSLSEFLGCTGWPDFCNHTEPMPAYVAMRRAGAIELPGLED